MRWKNLKTSCNVERRRGSGRRVAIGGGLGAIVMTLVTIFVFKKNDPMLLLGQLGQRQTQQETAGPDRKTTAEIDQFVIRIKGSTEEIWTKLFRQTGKTYRIPQLVNNDGRTTSETSLVADCRMGPFYLPSKETIYIDNAFFQRMKLDLVGVGDFSYAIPYHQL